MNEPAWPEDPDGGTDASTDGAHRLGYLRHGSHAPFFPNPSSTTTAPRAGTSSSKGGSSAANTRPPIQGSEREVRGQSTRPCRRDALQVRLRRHRQHARLPAGPLAPRSAKVRAELVPPPPLPPDASVLPSSPSEDNDNPSDDNAPTNKHVVKDAGIVKLGI